MNIQKSEVKIALTKEFGKQLDEKKKAAVKEQHAMAGELRALKVAAKKVSDLMTHVDKDLKEGKINEFLGEPMLVAKYAKRQYQHAVGVIDNLATQAEISAHRCAGLEIGFRQSCEFIEKMHNDELRKLESLQKAIDEGKVKLVEGELVVSDGERKGPGGHPGEPMKAKRLAEDTVETGKKKTVRKKSSTKPEKNKLVLVRDEKTSTPPDATTITGVAESAKKSSTPPESQN